jgi:hypothetical protein
MSDAGSRLLRSARNVRTFVRGEATEGFVAHDVSGRYICDDDVEWDRIHSTKSDTDIGILPEGWKPRQ